MHACTPLHVFKSPRPGLRAIPHAGVRGCGRQQRPHRPGRQVRKGGEGPEGRQAREALGEVQPNSLMGWPAIVVPHAGGQIPPICSHQVATRKAWWAMHVHGCAPTTKRPPGQAHGFLSIGRSACMDPEVRTLRAASSARQAASAVAGWLAGGHQRPVVACSHLASARRAWRPAGRRPALPQHAAGRGCWLPIRSGVAAGAHTPAWRQPHWRAGRQLCCAARRWWTAQLRLMLHRPRHPAPQQRTAYHPPQPPAPQQRMAYHPP